MLGKSNCVVNTSGGLSFTGSYTGEVTADSYGNMDIPLPNSGITSDNRTAWCVSVYIQLKNEPSTSDHSTMIVAGNYVGTPHATLKEYCSSAVQRYWNSDKEYIAHSYIKDDVSYYKYIFTVTLSTNLLMLDPTTYEDEVKNKTYLYVVNVYDTRIYV